MKLNKGFTLAEVLVTLGIIGVIASVVLPTLLSSAPNKEQIMLKKAYYLLSRNVNEMINDEDLYPERTDQTQAGFANTTIKDITADGNEAMFHGQPYSGAQKFCGLMAARMNTRGTVDCSRAISLANGGNFQTADGMIWSMPISEFGKGSAANSRQNITVDVTGTAGQNCFEGGNCKIPDRFTIQVDRFGKLYAGNGIEQEYLSCTKTNESYIKMKDNKNKGKGCGRQGG